MRGLLWCSLTLSTAGSFRPPAVKDELGCSPTLTRLLGRDYDKEPFFFDPLGIATDGNFARLRESELKAGRVAMLAVLETLLIPALKENTDWIPSNLSASISKSAQSTTVVDWIKVTIVCAILETFVFVQKDPKDMPGDYGVGFFGVRDKGLHERPLIMELEHSRLAMMAFLGQVVAEQVSGLSWDEQWLLIAKKWVNQFG